MPGLGEQRRAIRHQVRRDVVRMGRDWGLTAAAAYAGKKLGAIPAVAGATERLAARLGPSVGPVISRWGPAALIAKGTSLGLGAHSARATYKENRELARRVKVSRNTVTAFRAANPFIPTRLYVRRAFRKAHPHA